LSSVLIAIDPDRSSCYYVPRLDLIFFILFFATFYTRNRAQCAEMQRWPPVSRIWVQVDNSVSKCQVLYSATMILALPSDTQDCKDPIRCHKGQFNHVDRISDRFVAITGGDMAPLQDTPQDSLPTETPRHVRHHPLRCASWESDRKVHGPADATQGATPKCTVVRSKRDIQHHPRRSSCAKHAHDPAFFAPWIFLGGLRIILLLLFKKLPNAHLWLLHVTLGNQYTKFDCHRRRILCGIRQSVTPST